MYLITTDDYPKALANGNFQFGANAFEVPAELRDLPIEQLRVLDSQVVDAAKYAKFYIDSQGRKRLVQAEPDWPELPCSFSDSLVKDGAVWRVSTSSDELNQVKDAAKSAIDSQAESQRQLVLTQGSGQVMAYMLKLEEARSFLAASNVNPASTASNAAFPMLSAEVGITAPTLQAVAQTVMSANTSWRAFGAAIEKTRLSAKKAVEAAASSGAVETIVSNLSWPSAS